MSKFLAAAGILMLCVMFNNRHGSARFSEDLYYTNPVTFEIGTSLGQ